MLGTILFIIVAVIAVAAAIGMLTSTNAVHAAIFLVINFTCVALFYLGLHAPFLAMVQITVYSGAIMVLFLFVIMLLGAERLTLSSQLRWQGPLAVVLVLLMLGVMGFILLSPQVGVNLGVPPPFVAGSEFETWFGSPVSIGEELFTNYVLPFQLVGILLLVAMIGAVVLTREAGPRRNKDSEPERPARPTADR